MDEATKQKLFEVLAKNLMSSDDVITVTDRMVHQWATQDMARDIVLALGIYDEFVEFFKEYQKKVA